MRKRWSSRSCLKRWTECKGIPLSPSPDDRLSYLSLCRFRWVFCQLEVLRHCLPASIRQTLDQLPESLDETYLRVLRQIPQANQAHAHRMLQCLVVAIRPLRVEELAELLAFEFDAAQGRIPKYRATWQLDDKTQAVLSTCSSLVSIVNDGWYGCQVQFSHFSVKEFLMSNRLGGFSRYHIRPESAHTTLTQACLGSLLHLDGHVVAASVYGFPLAEYAARHWVEHAQFEDVVSHVKEGVEILFDSEKPHFAAWIGIHDIDTPTVYEPEFSASEILRSTTPNPLYYSVLCGFYDLVKHLAIKHPQLVNAICGQYGYPLPAALSEDYVEVAELLLEHGASVHVRGRTGKTILLNVLSHSQRDLASVVKLLLKHGADVNARDNALKSSLHLLAQYKGDLEVAQILLKHNADVHCQDDNGKTPLHTLLEGPVRYKADVLEHVRLLLEHGADVNIRDKDGQTPLYLAVREDLFGVAGILLEHGANADAENYNEGTALQLLSKTRFEERHVLNLALALLKHGADANRRVKDDKTPLHLAIRLGRPQLARIFS